jgi:hypothetical protein
MMESIFKFVEEANKYGFPLGLMALLIVLGVWAAVFTRWPEREKYYLSLLGALGQWKTTLEDQQAYYIEPGSDYRDAEIMQREGFRTLMQKENAAQEVIREQLNTGRLYLPDTCVILLTELIGNQWQISEMEAVCYSDYLYKLSPLVEQAYDTILLRARKDLRKSRYLALANRLFTK